MSFYSDGGRGGGGVEGWIEGYVFKRMGKEVKDDEIWEVS